MKDIQEPYINYRFKHKTEYVSPPESTFLFPCVLVDTVTLFAMFPLVLLLPIFSVSYMHDHQQGWSGDKDELESPQADVGDWEVVVKADIFTARLLGVTLKIFLVVAPDLLGCHHINHHSEEEDDG